MWSTMTTNLCICVCSHAGILYGFMLPEEVLSPDFLRMICSITLALRNHSVDELSNNFLIKADTLFYVMICVFRMAQQQKDAETARRDQEARDRR